MTSCGEEEAPVVAGSIVRPVKLLKVSSRAEDFQRRYPGRVRAARRVELSFKVGGPLVELKAEEGQESGKGNVLARIDPRDFKTSLKNARGQLAKSQATLSRARSELDRIQRIRNEDPGAASESMLVRRREAVDKARADIASLEAAVKSASDRLNDTYLRAPFNGVVSRRYVENFQEVRPKEPIVSIDDISMVEIVVDIPEHAMARVQDNRPKDIYAEFAAAPGKRFPLTIKEYATRADPATQTFQVVLEMPQPEELNILAGMTAMVTSYSPAEVLTVATFIVPAYALVAGKETGKQVWVLNPESMTVHRRAVKTGALTGIESIEIIDGLKRGDIIAVTGVSQLREGMRVLDLAKMEGYGQ